MSANAPNALQKRLTELKLINPDNLECSTCNNFPGWVNKQCQSINPLYFCTKHTGLTMQKYTVGLGISTKLKEEYLKEEDVQ